MTAKLGHKSDQIASLTVEEVINQIDSAVSIINIQLEACRLLPIFNTTRSKDPEPPGITVYKDMASQHVTVFSIRWDAEKKTFNAFLYGMPFSWRQDIAAQDIFDELSKTLFSSLDKEEQSTYLAQQALDRHQSPPRTRPEDPWKHFRPDNHCE